MSDKAWGGRFAEETHALAVAFSESVSFDKALAEHDIRGSLAHAAMLAQRGVISGEDAQAIKAGLEAIREEIRAGTFVWDSNLEDVHMNIEAALTQRIGEAGGRLHTGRSRNDQVATDLRLWCRDACETTVGHIKQLLTVLLVRAEENVDILIPGYTHLQRAQPVRLAHHLLAWCAMLERDQGRLLDARKRLNECPLGAGALATTTFPIDRAATAAQLGFDRPCSNSLDAVADRDFLVETVAALTNCAVHLSRIAEELVLWSSQEFGFCQMSDGFTTGSSMMPQKKNPDMAELVRGKSARVVGDLVNLVVLLKGLPLTYNRDLQEDKPPVFDAFRTVDDCLRVLAGALLETTFHRDAMENALKDGFLEATEIADWLADHGVPFRQSHHVAGDLVAYCVRHGKRLTELSLDEFRNAHAAFDDSIFAALVPETMVERRQVSGGPSRAAVNDALKALRARLEPVTLGTPPPSAAQAGPQ